MRLARIFCIWKRAGLGISASSRCYASRSLSFCFADHLLHAKLSNDFYGFRSFGAESRRRVDFERLDSRGLGVQREARLCEMGFPGPDLS